MRYEFIKKHQNEYPITMLCQMMNVSRSGYYAWLKWKPSHRQHENDTLWSAIQAAFQVGRGHYGYRRIHQHLRQLGFSCSQNRVARLMRQHELHPKRKRSYRRTTQSQHTYPLAPNRLNRCFTAQSPNQKWASDITYIATAEGWLYLAVVIDLYSRQVIGWAMDTHLKKELVMQALQMALAKRRPQQGLIHHSDRGSQYASHAYQAILKAHNILPSMSGKGDCYDNAPVESFFATLKKEAVQQQIYPTRERAKLALFEYIEVFYNRQRLHSTLGYLSPVQFEQQYSRN